MPITPDIAGFSRLVTALEPWLDQVVIIGGWAHRLYRWHPHAQKLEFAPLMTFDVDLALPPKLPNRARNIRDLLAAKGFQEDFRGDDKPPATHYRLGGEAGTFYTEFLTPLVGSELTRGGERRATADIAGVTSQQLRYVELLLYDPWSVELDPGRLEMPERKTVQIANPVSFIAQKLLIHKRRHPYDKARDILYVHDTLQVFGSRLDELRDHWTTKIAHQLHPNAARRVVRAPDWLFSEASDTIRTAAGIPTDRRLAPEALRESCRYGLQQVFR